MNFANSISFNFPAIMLETLETLKRFRSFMKLYNPNHIGIHKGICIKQKLQ